MLCAYTGEKKETDPVFAFLGKNRDDEYREKILQRLGKMGKGESFYLEIKKEIEKTP